MSSPSRGVDRRRGALERLAHGCAFHPVRTIVTWAALLVAIIFSAGAFGGDLVNEFTIPGSESQSAVDLLQQKFPERAGDSAEIVFASDHPLTDDAARQDIATARSTAAEVPGVVTVGDAYAGKGGGISKDGRIGFVDVQFDRPAAE